MDVSKFKYFIMLRGSTLKKVSEVLGINPATLSRKLSGESDFTRCEIIKLRSYLNLSLSEAEEIFFDSDIT